MKWQGGVGFRAKSENIFIDFRKDKVRLEEHLSEATEMRLSQMKLIFTRNLTYPLLYPLSIPKD